MLRVLVALLACAGCRGHFEQRDVADGDGGDDGAGCSAIPGLVAHYPMNAGDLTGSVLRDRSGNAYDGAIFGTGLALSPGQLGEALDFTPTMFTYVDISGLPLDKTAGAAVTVSLWFFRDSATVSNDVLFDMPPSPRYDLWLTGVHLCVNTQSSECWGVSDAALFDRWVHAAVVLVNGPEVDSTMFIDGVQQQLLCAFAPCTAARVVANPLRLGTDDGYYYRGKLDDFRLYDHALSAGEIAALYTNTACP